MCAIVCMDGASAWMFLCCSYLFIYLSYFFPSGRKTPIRAPKQKGIVSEVMTWVSLCFSLPSPLVKAASWLGVLFIVYVCLLGGVCCWHAGHVCSPCLEDISMPQGPTTRFWSFQTTASVWAPSRAKLTGIHPDWQPKWIAALFILRRAPHSHFAHKTGGWFGFRMETEAAFRPGILNACLRWSADLITKWTADTDSR